MNFVFQYLLLIVIFFFQHVSFGTILLRLSAISNLRAVEKITLGILLSLLGHSAIFFLLGHFIGTNVYYLSLVSIIIGLLNFKYSLKIVKTCVSEFNRNKYLGAFAILSSLTLAFTLTFSWIHSNGDLIFQAGQLHDSAWHIALTNKLVENIPPEHPSNYELVVTNYHYFYNLILASWNKLFSISIPLAYFQFMPVITSLLLCAAAVCLGKRLGGKVFSAFLVFLTFFTGSFAYLIPLFIPGNRWHESSFWVSQTFNMMLNPQLILSLALLYSIVLLTFLISAKKKVHRKHYFVLIFLISTSLGLKSYAFVVTSIIFGLFVLQQAVLKKSWKVLLLIPSLLLFSLPTIWLVTGFDSNSFIFLPLWFIDSMVESPDRLNYITWAFLFDHYVYKQRWFHLIWLRARQIAIFYVGNLGIRSVGLFTPLLAFLFKFKLRKIYYMVFFSFVVSSIIPLLFIQRGVVWNTIQFWYYSLLLANILSAKLFSYAYSELTNKNLARNLGRLIMIIAIIGLSIPTYLQVVKIKFFNTETFNSSELKLMNTISEDDHVLVHPGLGRYYQTSIISAFTNASMIYANPVQLKVAGMNFDDNEDELINLIEKEPDLINSTYSKLKPIVITNRNMDELSCLETDSTNLVLCR